MKRRRIRHRIYRRVMLWLWRLDEIPVSVTGYSTLVLLQERDIR